MVSSQSSALSLLGRLLFQTGTTPGLPRILHLFVGSVKLSSDGLWAWRSVFEFFKGDRTNICRPLGFLSWILLCSLALRGGWPCGRCLRLFLDCCDNPTP